MIKTITPEKVRELGVSALPTHPNAPSDTGVEGYSSAEVKTAFDALALHIVERYNELVIAINAYGSDSLAAHISTGVMSQHKLSDLFFDIRNGNFACYLKVGETPLDLRISQLQTEINLLKEAVNNGGN